MADPYLVAIKKGSDPALTELERPRRADRWKAYRARQRRGAVVVQVEVSPELINLLLGLRWLEEREIDDRRAVASAITRMLRSAAP
jgi:hypothetical protein